MNLIIYFILFSNILLVNSTLTGENAESNDGVQQNDEQMPNNNQPNYQPQWDHQFEHLEEDPFDYSQYYDLLADGNNFDQRASSATAIEFDDWEYEDGDSQGFEEQTAEIDGGNGKGKGKKERQDRIRFSQILKELRKVSDKCEFPILDEIAKAHQEKERGKQHVKKSDIWKWKGTFLLSRRAILVMESWMIKLEKELKFIEIKQLNESNISIEELILNAKQNQKILEKHPLPFIENESPNILAKSHKRKRNKRMVKAKNEERKKINEYERNRRRGINDVQIVLFSTVPKEYIIQMTNFMKETNMQTVIKYMEFLLNLLHPFKGHIRQLTNSTLPGTNAGSSGGGQQNIGQISKQNEHQPKMDNQFQHLEEDPFSQYYDILKSGSHENKYIDLLPPQFINYHPRTELHSNSHLGDQSTNPHLLPDNLPSSGNSNNFDKIASSAADDEFINFGNIQESFDDDEQQKVVPGKGKSKSKHAGLEKRRRNNFSQNLIHLQELQTEKCVSVLDEMTKFHPEKLPKRRFKGNDTFRRTFSLTYHCIRFMENWIIKMEDKLIEMEIGNRNKGKDTTSISIEELILNAQQNQKIQEKHPLFFTEGEKAHNKLESNRKRTAKINESIQIFFSLIPKGFIIKMMNFTKESILETVIEYMEFLFNLVDPFMGHIWQAKEIGQSEQNAEKIGHELRSRKRQRNGD